MRKFLFAMVWAVSLATFSNRAAYSETYPFGDPPYLLDFTYDPRVGTGCLKWQWQQYLWKDYCPVYVHPKAYMHPRGAALRTRG